jgi:hypothetical protein
MDVSHRRPRLALLATIAALSAAPPLFADRVVTTDGRVLMPKKAREKDGGYVLAFEHGEVVLKDKSLVKAVEIEGDMSEYVPQSDDERKKLEQGFVRFEGKWLSKPAYEDELRRRTEASRKRADDAALHSDFGNAWEKVTKHFTVRTNTSPELLGYYCDLLETYYSLMDDRFGIKPSPTLKRTSMVVNVYKNRREFHKLNAAGLGGGVAGYFSPVTKDLNFYHDYQEPSISDWVSLHECTHLLTFLIDPQYVSQIWLNEAVADYFGSADISRDKKGKLVITPGKLQTDRVLTVQQAIKDGNDIKLERLFTLTKPEFHAFEYSHAWSFIYFLNNCGNPKYKRGFDKFFKDIYTLAKGIEFETVAHYDKSGTGKQVPAKEIRRVVLESLGASDPVALDREWKKFIAEVPVDGPMARFKRGYRMVVYGEMFGETMEQTRKNMESALADLDAAIAGGITDPRAWSARAQLKELMGKEDEAQADVRAALAADPLNPAYHFALARLVWGGLTGIETEGFRIDVSTDMKQPEVTDEARRHFGLAMELAPESDFYREQFEKIVGSR